MSSLQDSSADESSPNHHRLSKTGSLTSSTSSIPFLNVWERGRASELLFQSTTSRGLATSSPRLNVRRSGSGSPPSRSREYIRGILTPVASKDGG